MQPHLRVYALTLRNKFVAAYFGTIAATRYAMIMSSALGIPVEIIDLPQIPIPLDTSNACLLIPQLRFRPVSNALATTFGG